jgi:hypothetical protein
MDCYKNHDRTVALWNSSFDVEQAAALTPRSHDYPHWQSIGAAASTSGCDKGSNNETGERVDADRRKISGIFRAGGSAETQAQTEAEAERRRT